MGAPRRVWAQAADSLWLRPTVALVAALAIGAILASVEVPPDSWMDQVVFDGSADDARGLLTVVVGTMITVTSLVFVLTVVALQIASTQFSPRLLRSFLRDRGTQAVLSTFVGTVAYALAGLHQVGRIGPDGTLFVPRLAVSGALLLALLSVGMLVYYIQHITHSIRIDTIMRQVETTALRVLARDHPATSSVVARLEAPDDAAIVLATKSGYLEDVDGRALAADAARAGLCVHVLPLIGWFVVAGRPLATVWHPSGVDVDEKAATAMVARRVHFERDRHAERELGVGLRQLVDIAGRAASTSTQDVYTAVQALHHLTVVLADAAGRSFAPRTWTDRQGVARVRVDVLPFVGHLQVVCDQVRQLGGDRHPRLTLELLRLLQVVGERADGSDLDAVLGHVELVAEHANRAIAHPHDRAEVSETAAAIRAALARPGSDA